MTSAKYQLNGLAPQSLHNHQNNGYAEKRFAKLAALQSGQSAIGGHCIIPAQSYRLFNINEIFNEVPNCSLIFPQFDQH